MSACLSFRPSQDAIHIYELLACFQGIIPVNSSSGSTDGLLERHLSCSCLPYTVVSLTVSLTRRHPRLRTPRVRAVLLTENTLSGVCRTISIGVYVHTPAPRHESSRPWNGEKCSTWPTAETVICPTVCLSVRFLQPLIDATQVYELPVSVLLPLTEWKNSI